MSNETESPEHGHLICKNGMFYRPDSCGYTSAKSEAGRYSLNMAIDITHPNGPDGPRDGMTYIHETEVPDPRADAKDVWPNFKAPPMYSNPSPDWVDAALPDFRLIWSTAKLCGYAIGLHGSMKRDVDLIAVPWTDSAEGPDRLINDLCRALNARMVGGFEKKPFGRLAVTIQIDGFYKAIDLSIIPKDQPNDQ